MLGNVHIGEQAAAICGVTSGLVPVGISSVASSNRDLLNDAGENLTALGVRGGYLC